MRRSIASTITLTDVRGNKDSDIAAIDNARMQQLPISLRRCLTCDHWMRSTGADHRKCNECKGIEEHETRIWAEKVAYWRGGQKVA